MTSPNSTQLIAAVVCAVLAYVVGNSIELTSITVAIIALVSAIVPTLFAPASQAQAEDDVRTLYVGNLPYRANEGAVRALFSDHGKVHSVRLMKDKNTGKRRGFGFVEMSANDADAAIKKLNDSEFQQRTLKVREAKERPDNASDE